MKKHNASENSFKKKILIICAACGVCIALVIAGVALYPKEPGPVFSQEPIPLPETSGEYRVSYNHKYDRWYVADNEISDHAEPYFNEYATTIFKGTLTRVTNIIIGGNIKNRTHHALLEYWVEDVYRGDCKKGDYVIVMMYDTVVEDNPKITIGSSGIYMVKDYDEDNSYQYVEGLADYTIIDDRGVCFRDHSGVPVFDKQIHSAIKDATTWEEVEAYIRKMIKETQ